MINKIDNETAKKLMEEDVIILDVRGESEYAKGFIEGAINTPLQSITMDLLSSKNIEKDAKILIYCYSGMRSNKAAELLSTFGYENIYDMGGLKDWKY